MHWVHQSLGPGSICCRYMYVHTLVPDTNTYMYMYVLMVHVKYEKHFPKMYGDVGMAVPKTTQTRYMDGSVQATQMTTQVTPSLHHFSFLSSTQSSFQYSDNKASLCGFWHCHPYIPIHFWKMFFILVCVPFCCTTLPYRRLSLSKFSTNAFSMHVC